MLEKYFLKPDTVDRIRASWIGEPIEQYVKWLDEQGYAARNVYRRVPILRHFGDFALQQGAKRFDDLKIFVEPFIACWLDERRNRYKKEIPRWVEITARTPVEQMLRLILPGFKGKGRSQRLTPFLEQAPAFFPYLHEERGLKKSSILHYNHYLRLFEIYLKQIRATDPSELTPAILSAFIVKECNRLSKSASTALCCSLRVFLRYLHRTGVTGRDLSGETQLRMKGTKRPWTHKRQPMQD